ncbi:MAG TPA: nickel pincer cofactor biosynthesis protein LarB [Candidatus Avacidaminococcus intestinavium]|uniref:Nickel pincer cofactor biosynthesis protein LarB n=1 Tax=Candidatus Avacidaminococcus intestinavium TaxID=2840684 RepID=A0A9D1MQ44_9FIRM|nr:nickel pincer cofactor biosynthesis protein LarB [Candidatus Avacidaminococcus intestinavium]
MLSILEKHKQGQLTSQEVLTAIQSVGCEDLGFAKIDHARSFRQGFPEVVYCEGKTPEQNASIMYRLSQSADNILGTRASAESFQAVQEKISDAQYHQQAGLITVERKPLPRDEMRKIAVVTAGTSDLAVAEEAAITAEIMGNHVVRIYDVGVAGIHRLFERLEDIRSANVVIVLAGMEGALASVIGGLVAKPVIAVPTSAGYGANFGGLAALLGMLNSCAAGVAVVNIDNGFGAGRMACIINHMR